MADRAWGTDSDSLQPPFTTIQARGDRRYRMIKLRGMDGMDRRQVGSGRVGSSADDFRVDAESAPHTYEGFIRCMHRSG